MAKPPNYKAGARRSSRMSYVELSLIHKPLYIFSLNHAGVIDGATLQSDYDTAQAIASEPIYDTIVEEGQEYIELSPLNTATVSTIWLVTGLSDLKM